VEQQKDGDFQYSGEYLMPNLTKRDLVVRISNETGMVQQKVLNVIQCMLDHLTESLSNGQAIELRNFGIFAVKLRRVRIAGNLNRRERDERIPFRAVPWSSSRQAKMKAKVMSLCMDVPTGKKLEANRHHYPVVWLTEKGKNAKGRIGETGIKILTMHSSKDLQFKAVILLFANDCPRQSPDSNDEDERRLFYVALTRAEDFLAISRSGKSAFIDQIETAMRATESA